MKRGLISWDREELPVAAFEARLGVLHQLCADYDVPAVVAYSDVCRSNDVRYISNYMPYWNRALTVIPRGEKPILLCALSPRVYPWIKSVTVHEVILPSPSLPAQLAKLCTENGWEKVGMLDHGGLPNDLYTQLGAEKFALVDIPRSVFRPAATESELAMHRRGAILARGILEAEMTAAALGLTDYELAGRLERRFRRAGAEDLVLLFSDGRTAPLPARGNNITENSSATVALEYNGHWVKLSRNTARVICTLPPTLTADVHLETLSGRYPWEGINAREEFRNVITSIQVGIGRGDNRLYYGDTGLQAADGWQPL
ncbi:MAG: hypothetical protein JWM63_5201 [Gammaproteobacteria bacterium]|jgi:hypothetical protein|nr:hypothetical protein [Gammaproteobacteria bacterium]